MPRFNGDQHLCAAVFRSANSSIGIARANPQLLRFLIGFARHGTPGKWREAMEVFTEVNSIGMNAYDELAKAATSSALHIRQRRRRPAAPGIAQLPAPPP
ncbi:hypothetical protein [Arthrobacter crystallopoietes]|uniref:hypothetical protein n=1 Tax=Crystallibacter crystallopoietes TaxID=37928 RepID=UPI000944CFB8|nr:hypothetical protein [Arthrobacter crystallopoietes]AUI50900.1 hypothetical protein AC20117_08815 [Arthrobacter crystallopoietes]